jgi:general secretion pathway protein J
MRRNDRHHMRTNRHLLSYVRHDFYRQGLTLIELLVAISILAFIAVIGWSGLDSITRTRESLNHELEQARSLQLTLAQWQIDCANAVDADLLDGHTPLLIENGQFTLARRVQTEAQPTVLQIVAWRLNGGVLSRETSQPTRDLTQLNAAWQRAYTGGETAVNLLSGVKSVSFRVWASDGRGWRAWDPGTQAMVSHGALANTQTGTTSTQLIWRGVEMSLQLSGRASPLTKIFLLGAT